MHMQLYKLKAKNLLPFQQQQKNLKKRLKSINTVRNIKPFQYFETGLKIKITKLLFNTENMK